MKLVITMLALSLPIAVLGEDAADKPVELTVKPLLCIVDKRTPGCDMSFLVKWRSRQTGYYCVFNELEDGPLRCWRERRSGELNDERSVREDVSFWINEGGGEPLDSVTVTVLRMDSDDRRQRRRTRHVWDLL